MSKAYVVKGRIYTGHDKEKSDYEEAFWVEDGHIKFVGNYEEVKKKAGNVPVRDYGESFISPGYTDGHAHISFASSIAGGIDLSNIKNPEVYYRKIREYKEANPGLDYVKGQGYTSSVFGEKGPSKEILDEIYPDTPVYIQADSLHEIWVNSVLLKQAGVDRNTPDPKDGKIIRDKNGEPTGNLHEEACSLVRDILPETTTEDYKKAILFFQDKVLPLGTVNVFEPIINDEKVVRAYRELEEEGKLKLKVRAAYRINENDDLEKSFADIKHFNEIGKSEHFSIIGVKLFMDGVVEGRTALLLDDYSDEPGFNAEPLWNQEKLNEAVLNSLNAGYLTHTHAIGDGGLEMILKALEYAVPLTPNKDLRNAVTHLQVVDESQYRRLAAAAKVGVINTFWHYKSHSHYYTREIPFLGEFRVNREYPLRSLFNEGIVLSQASDWPVSEPPAPLNGLEIAATRRGPGNRDESPLNEGEGLELHDAYDLLTKGGSFQLGLENINGSIRAGLSADYIVLDRNPFETDIYEVHNTKVKEVYIDGERAY